MGNIGVPELIVIFVVALLVFGPRKLPEIGKSLGKALKEFQRARNELISTVEEEVRKIETEPTPTTSPTTAQGHTDSKPTVEEEVRRIETEVTTTASPSTSQAHTDPKPDSYPPNPTGPTG